MKNTPSRLPQRESAGPYPETSPPWAARSRVSSSAAHSDTGGSSIPLEDLKMRWVNLFSIYELGACLGPLRLVGLLESNQAREVLFAAQQQLRNLRERELASLEILAHSASGISAAVDEATTQLGESGRVSGDEERLLSAGLREFETILAAQGPTLHSLVLAQLRGFSMSILIERAEENFSPEVIRIVECEAKKDIQEAGRCLAFELPTAAGIHLMRAFGKVLRRYFERLTGESSEGTDTLTMIERLRERGTAHPKTLAILEQIRDFHADPLGHEAFLGMDEALELFDIAKSAITAMASQL